MLYALETQKLYLAELIFKKKAGEDKRELGITIKQVVSVQKKEQGYLLVIVI